MYTVDITNIFILIFIFGTVFSFLIRHLLAFLNYTARKNLSRHPMTETLPELFTYPAAQSFNTEKLTTITRYKNALYRSWIPSSILSVTVSLALVLTGFYPWILDCTLQLTGNPQDFISTYCSFFLFYFVAGLPGFFIAIPFDLYNEFKIEKKFEFSKMTLSLWFKDLCKSQLISLIMSAILLVPVTAVLILFPHNWWIFVSLILFVFILAAQILYPLVIAPLFNKFTPLEDGELKDAITELMQKTGFKASGVYVMDASKRSGHSNAYFTGFGKSKRIVLFDTLIKQLTTEELTAVLAHELGHYAHHHILKRFLLIIPLEFVLTYCLFLLANLPSLYEGFGFYQIQTQGLQSLEFVGLFLAMLLFEAVQEIIEPLINWGSRKDEYQADAFAATLTGASDHLINALIKLNSENLSDLLPSKLYVFWNYSHPTLLERIRQLQKHR